jgi:hypothetical protein
VNLLLCSPRRALTHHCRYRYRLSPASATREARDPAVANAFLAGMPTLDAKRDAVFKVPRATGLAPTGSARGVSRRPGAADRGREGPRADRGGPTGPSGAVIAGHLREIAAELGSLSGFVSICRSDLPAGNTIE